MELDEALDDGEAETEPLARSRLAVLLLAEGGEEEALEFGGKPAPVIPDRELDPSLGVLQLHLDVAAMRRELHRVREQLAHDLPESDGIGADPWRVFQRRLDADALAVGRGPERLDGVARARGRIDRFERHAQLSRHHPGHVEEIVHETRLLADAFAKREHRLRGSDLLLQRIEPQTHGRERRPELVREHGDELVLHAVDFSVDVFREQIVRGCIHGRRNGVHEKSYPRRDARSIRNLSYGFGRISVECYEIKNVRNDTNRERDAVTASAPFPRRRFSASERSIPRAAR